MKQNNQKEKQKLSYEELSKAASDLHVQYQKLVVKYKEVVQALQNKEFEETSFLLSSLFKVLENHKHYDEIFVKWCADNVKAAITSYYDSMMAKGESDTTENNETE